MLFVLIILFIYIHNLYFIYSFYFYTQDLTECNFILMLHHINKIIVGCVAGYKTDKPLITKLGNYLYVEPNQNKVATYS